MEKNKRYHQRYADEWHQKPVRRNKTSVAYFFQQIMNCAEEKKYGKQQACCCKCLAGIFEYRPHHPGDNKGDCQIIKQQKQQCRKTYQPEIFIPAVQYKK